MKLKYLLASLLFPVVLFGANTNVMDNLLIKQNLTTTSNAMSRFNGPIVGTNAVLFLGPFTITNNTTHIGDITVGRAGVTGRTTWSFTAGLWTRFITTMSYNGVEWLLDAPFRIATETDETKFLFGNAANPNGITFQPGSGSGSTPVISTISDTADASVNLNIFPMSGTTSVSNFNVLGTMTTSNAVRILNTLFYTNGVAGVGKVMTSDATGNITLQAVAGGGGDVFRASNNVYAAGTTQFMAHASVSNTLQVIGQTRLLDGLFFTNGANVVGNVMTTDGAGNITLTAPSGGGTPTVSRFNRSGFTGGSAFTFATVTNGTTIGSTGLVRAVASFMSVPTAQLVVFARVYGGGVTNIVNFTQASAQSNPIAGQVSVDLIITNQTTFTFDVWSSGASLGYTNQVPAGATYPAMQNPLGLRIVEFN